MSIDISAKMIVGKPFKEIERQVDEDTLEEIEEMLYAEDLEYASPYYDSPREDWIVGVEVHVAEGDLNIQASVDFAADEFFLVTGIEGNLHICPHVY